MAFQFPEFIKQAEAALAAYEKAKVRKAYPAQQPASSSGFKLSQAVSRTPVSIFQQVDGDKANPTNTKLIAIVLVDYFNHPNGYSWPSRAELEELTGVKARGLRVAVTALQATGLFGVLPGDGRFNSRYYPLFHTGSYKAFLEVIELAKQGIHPHSGVSPVATTKPVRQKVFPQ